MEKSKVKEKIILESIELFMRYSLKSVTMDDIAKNLGISKKTIYLHFKDKEEIIYLTTSMYFEKEKIEMDEMKKDSNNALEHLFNISIWLQERLRNINRSILFDLKKYYKRAWENYKRHKQEVIFDCVRNNLKLGIEEGLYRSSINPEILSYLRIGVIELTFDKGNFPEDKFTISEINEQIFDHFTHGILSAKGIKQLETYKKLNK